MEMVIGDCATYGADVLIGDEDDDVIDGEPGTDTVSLGAGDEEGQDVLILDGSDEMEHVLVH